MRRLSAIRQRFDSSALAGGFCDAIERRNSAGRFVAFLESGQMDFTVHTKQQVAQVHLALRGLIVASVEEVH